MKKTLKPPFYIYLYRIRVWLLYIPDGMGVYTRLMGDFTDFANGSCRTQIWDKITIRYQLALWPLGPVRFLTCIYIYTLTSDGMRLLTQER